MSIWISNGGIYKEDLNTCTTMRCSGENIRRFKADTVCRLKPRIRFMVFERNSEKEFISFYRKQTNTDNIEQLKKYEFGLKSWKLTKLFRTIQNLLQIDRVKKSGMVFMKYSNWFSITEDLAQFVLEAAIALVGVESIRCNGTNLISKISKQSWWIYLVRALVLELLVKLLNLVGILHFWKLM